jgi:glycosyltransferase involved in cell wall biosynthesis
MTLIPVSVVIPTRDRPTPLRRATESLLASTVVPAEFVIVDASASLEANAALRSRFAAPDAPRLVVERATRVGAAAQRNQAMSIATQPFVLFCDDDIVCEPDCVERLWDAMQADSGIGGANAMIVNQKFVRPGRKLRLLLAMFGEREGESYAGRVVGPAIGFLPRDCDRLPDAVPVQWLNLGCTLYRRSHLPDPPFDTFFDGYSIGEDIALSLRVGAKARLVNVPAARILHDSQPGAHKADAVALARMDLVNRHYIMTEVLGRRSWRDAGKLAVWEIGQLAMSAIGARGGRTFRQSLCGKLAALDDIARGRSSESG